MNSYSSILALAGALFFFLAGLAHASPHGPATHDRSLATSGGHGGLRVMNEVRHTDLRATKRYRIKRRNRSRNRRLSLATIRSAAIRETLRDLEALRPYTRNFGQLRIAIRRYWTHNITRPTTNGLAGTIMAHVKGFYKGLVRSEVYAGSAAGIVKVRKALRQRRR